MKDDKYLTPKDVWPELSDEEAKEAEVNVRNFCKAIYNMAARLSQDPVAAAEFNDRLRKEKEERDKNAQLKLGI